MHAFPASPALDAADRSVLAEGHLWLLEHVAGEPLRFRLLPSGLIEFGTRERACADPEELPPRYRHAILHVRDHLQRDALRAAVDDPGDVTFFGIATQADGIDYDWAALPSVLGVDVRTDEREDPYPPDVTHAIFEEIGLDPITPIEREARPRDFDPDSYEHPTSAWYDGPAAGTLVRNKRGGRVLLSNDDCPPTPPAAPSSLDAFVDEVVDRIDGQLADRDDPITVERLAERLVAAAWRSHHAIIEDPRSPIDDGELCAACTRRARGYLA